VKMQRPSHVAYGKDNIMGTNYYASTGACPRCGHSGHVVHVGKNSAGWAFSLRVYPDSENELPTSFPEWESWLHEPDVTIADEYGGSVEVDDLLELVQHKEPWGNDDLKEHDGEPGTYYDPDIRLLRHVVDGRTCIGHGAGTYDYMTGDFC
jgi:glutaredoxin-related protein